MPCRRSVTVKVIVGFEMDSDAGFVGAFGGKSLGNYADFVVEFDGLVAGCYLWKPWPGVDFAGSCPCFGGQNVDFVLPDWEGFLQRILEVCMGVYHEGFEEAIPAVVQNLH